VNNHIDQNRPPCIPDHSVPVYCPGCADEDEQPVSAAVSAVRPPATNRTALREQIAEALRPHASLGGTPPRWVVPLFDGATPSLPRISGWRPLDEVADAVLAVLPAVDQAAVVAERDALGREADRLRKDWVEMRNRAERAEAEAHQYRTALQGVARRAAVPPEPADQAAVLREAADAVARDREATIPLHSAWAKGMRRAEELLRRLAAEPAAAGPDQTGDETRAETVHACPPDGSGLTPCCGRAPFELPSTDRMTATGTVTCAPAVGGAQQQEGV
jgi:hypothetical protein